MRYTWGQFKTAVDDLILTNANRAGTEAAKLLKVKLGAKKMQECVDRYRVGHQEIYSYSDLSPQGFASQGDLPEDAEPRDAYMVGTINVTVSNTADAADDELTVTAHGITAATNVEEVEVGRFSNSGGSLHGGVVANQSYFIRVVDADTVTLHSSAQGAIDNENRVDITGDGSGTTTLKYGLKRYPLNLIRWTNRHELIEAAISMSGSSGFITFDPNSDTFISFPQVPVGPDDNDRTWSVEINWDGIKLEWDDNDTTPFDDEAVDGVAEYVNAWFLRLVDSDFQGADAAMKAHKNIKATSYLKGRRMKDLKE